MKHLRRLAAALALLAMMTHVASAASGTISVLDGTAAPQKYQVTVLPSGVFIGNMNICDPSGSPCGGVDANGLQVDASIGKIAGVGVAVGAGASNTGTQRIVLSTDSTVAIQAGSKTNIVGNAAGVMDAVGQNATAPTNWLQIGCQFNTSPSTITSGNGSPFQCNSAGQLLVSAQTTGGTWYHLAGGSAASTNATLISTGPHTLLSLWLENTNTTIGYFRLYDTAAAPTCSSATGALASIPVGAAAASGQVAGISVPITAVGGTIANGLSFCITGGGSDTDNTNAPTGIFVTALYK